MEIYDTEKPYQQTPGQLHNKLKKAKKGRKPWKKTITAQVENYFFLTGVKA